MRIIITKSARRDYKKLDTPLKSKIKKIIKSFRKGQLNITKLTDMGNSWKIKVDNYRIILEKDKDDFILRGIEAGKDVY